jgi:hypothetical protein
VFTVERYFASKWCVTVRESLSNVYRDKYMTNSTPIHRLITSFRYTGSICDTKHAQCQTLLTRETLQKAEETLAPEQLPNCQSSLVRTLLDMTFGHRDLHTLPRYTSFCEDFSKKEFIRITHKAWRKRNTISNAVLPTLT